MTNKLDLLIAQLSDEQCQLIEDAILEIANKGKTDITFPDDLNEIIDKMLDY